MANQSKQRRGFVLVMTLLLLVVVAIGMVALSRRSLQRAVEASLAQEELQQRWGTTSSRAAFLPAAQTVLGSVEKKTGMPCRVATIELRLGSQAFSLLVADEQAKANVNAILERRGKRDLETSLRNLIRASRNPTPSLRLRMPIALAGEMSPIRSFGQLFEGPEPAALVSDQNPLDTVASYVTCWGSGVVNFSRTSREALTEVTAPLLTKYDVDRLVLIRDKTPGVSPKEAMSALDFEREKQEKLLPLLRTGSDCYSLWVINDTGGRKSSHLFVLWLQSQKEEMFSYSW